MTKHNGKVQVRSISVPEEARFNAGEMRAACNRFLRSRGIDRDFREHSAAIGRLSMARKRGDRKAGAEED